MNMWTCPKCGRIFRNVNQSHYCGAKPATVDAYIAAQDPAVQPVLNKVRDTLRNALPECQEKISWSMPTYWKGANIIHFAASKKHLGIYPGGEAAAYFAKELKPYDTSKGTIRFPYDKVDYDLLVKIAGWCLVQNGK